MHNQTDSEETSLSYEPWYKQFWPWFLIALPGTVVIAGFITLAIAILNPDKIIHGNYEKLGTVITETTNSETLSK